MNKTENFSACMARKVEWPLAVQSHWDVHQSPCQLRVQTHVEDVPKTFSMRITQ